MGRRYYSSKKKRNAAVAAAKAAMMNGTTTTTNNNNNNGTSNHDSNNNNMDDQSYQLWLLDSTRNDVIRYLNIYRQGCYDFYNQATIIIPSMIQDGKKTTTTTTKKKTTSIDITMNDGNIHIIGMIEFPQLNHDVFQQPYLLLPHTLSSKQRKILHECCLQLDIYHDSVNDKSCCCENNNNTRIMVVSCYADGFQYLPDHYKEQIINTTTTTTTTTSTTITTTTTKSTSTGKVLDLHLYKPWYCRSNNSTDNDTTVISSSNSINGSNSYNSDTAVTLIRYDSDILQQEKNTIDDQACATAGTPTKSNRSIVMNGSLSGLQRLSMEKRMYTQQCKEQIWNLIDQPGHCIRDCDVISYTELHQKTLANYNYQNIKTTPWTLVDTPYKMQQCVQDLLHPDITEIAFDIESYNMNASTQITCLLQITSNLKKEYIIDPLSPGVFDEISKLQIIFGNPNIVKIGHAIASLDVPSLYRDFGIIMINVFDTYEAAKCIPQIAPYGLAGLCQYYYMKHGDLYQSLKDQYQTCNWRVRPLTTDMMLYGRMDVHYLINLRKLLIRDMILAYNPMIWKTSAITTTKVTETTKVISSFSATAAKLLDEEENGGVVVETNLPKVTEEVSSDHPSAITSNTLENDVVVVVENGHDVPMKEDEVVENEVVVVDPINTSTTTITDKTIMMNGQHSIQNDDGDLTATSVGDDPFLSEVHYNKLIPPSSSSGPILAKNRDVFDFMSRFSTEEDYYDTSYVATSPTATSATNDESVMLIENDDDDHTNASYNTAFQSLHPKSSSANGSFSDSLNYNSDALYNTATEEEDEDDVAEEVEGNQEEGMTTEPKDITPEELRLQPIVMQCIGISQERCLNLWNDKKHEENHLNNESYLSILRKKSVLPSSTVSVALNDTNKNTKGSKKTKGNKGKAPLKSIEVLPIEPPATTMFDKDRESFTKLYIALVDWRRYVADEVLECLPGFVVSLDFLVSVAYKRPMTLAGLQLIAQQLPIALQPNESIRDSLLDVVIQHTMVFQQMSIPTATIYYYSNLKLGERMKDKEKGMTASVEASKAITDTFIARVLIGGTLSFGFFASFYDVIKSNPQPVIEILKERIPLYMNHFWALSMSAFMNSIHPFVPFNFRKK